MKGTTKVESNSYGWEVSTKRGKDDRFVHCLLVKEAEGNVPLAAIFGSCRLDSGVNENNIGAIVQFGKLSGWNPKVSLSEDDLDDEFFEDDDYLAEEEEDDIELTEAEEMYSTLITLIRAKEDEMQECISWLLKNKPYSGNRPQRVPQIILPNPFTLTYPYFLFPTSIEEFLEGNEHRQILHGDENCVCRLCKFIIHNNRCNDCGGLLRTHAAEQCMGCGHRNT